MKKGIIFTIFILILSVKGFSQSFGQPTSLFDVYGYKANWGTYFNSNPRSIPDANWVDSLLGLKNLQAVTTAGNTTSNQILINYPSGDGLILKQTTAGVSNYVGTQYQNDATGTGVIGIASSTWTQQPTIQPNQTFIQGYNGLSLTTTNGQSITFGNFANYFGQFNGNGVLSLDDSLLTQQIVLPFDKFLYSRNSIGQTVPIIGMINSSGGVEIGPNANFVVTGNALNMGNTGSVNFSNVQGGSSIEALNVDADNITNFDKLTSGYSAISADSLGEVYMPELKTSVSPNAVVIVGDSTQSIPGTGPALRLYKSVKLSSLGHENLDQVLTTGNTSSLSATFGGVNINTSGTTAGVNVTNSTAGTLNIAGVETTNDASHVGIFGTGSSTYSGVFGIKPNDTFVYGGIGLDLIAPNANMTFNNNTQEMAFFDNATGNFNINDQIIARNMQSTATSADSSVVMENGQLKLLSGSARAGYSLASVLATGNTATNTMGLTQTTGDVVTITGTATASNDYVAFTAINDVPTKATLGIASSIYSNQATIPASYGFVQGFSGLSLTANANDILFGNQTTIWGRFSGTNGSFHAGLINSYFPSTPQYKYAFFPASSPDYTYSFGYVHQGTGALVTAWNADSLGNLITGGDITVNGNVVGNRTPTVTLGNIGGTVLISGHDQDFTVTWTTSSGGTAGNGTICQVTPAVAYAVANPIATEGFITQQSATLAPLLYFSTSSGSVYLNVAPISGVTTTTTYIINVHIGE